MSAAPHSSWALLRGREHTELGAVDLIGEGPAAIALTIGGAPKAYAHTDPNEDAVLYVVGPHGTLLAVADGHRGCEAAEIALEHLAANPAPDWTEAPSLDPDRWRRYVLAVLCDTNSEILRELAESEKAGSRTTLALALLRPGEDSLLWASVGDSHIFRVGARGAEDLAGVDPEHRYFLGHQAETPEGLGEKCALGVEGLEDTVAVVVATDGLSERQIGVNDPEAAVEDAVERARAGEPPLRPLTAARCLVESAMEAHRRNPSGDNTSAAVAWVGQEAAPGDAG